MLPDALKISAGNRTRDMAPLNLDIMLIFVDVLESDAFVETFSLDSVNIISLHDWEEEHDIPETCGILSLMTEKAERRAAGKRTQKRAGILAHINGTCMQEGISTD